MPDVNKIIADYKEAARQKELERQAELDAKKQQRALNAKVAEDCIKTIIEPVFENVKAQIIQNGFPCDVEFVSKKDHFLSEAKMFAIGIKILIQNKADSYPGNKCNLLYEGSFEAQEITKSEWIAMAGKPADKSPPVAISRVNTEMIEKDLEQFLLKVFKV